MMMVSMLALASMQLAPWCSMRLLTLSLLCLPTLHAAVQPVQEAAFMVAGSKLYIQGGKNEYIGRDGNLTYTPQAQLLSLDLSKDWPTSAPEWSILAPGASMYLFVGVAATDNRTVITFNAEKEKDSIRVNTYDITSDSWKLAMSRTGLPDDIREGMRAVVDPNSGLVYINSNLYMHVFDPRDNMIKRTTLIEGDIMPTRKFAGVAYLKSRQKIIYMGGLTGFNMYGFNMDISEYSPQTEGWTVWKTKGDGPSLRTDHCLATNEDGSIVVVYGGRIPKSNPNDPATEFTGSLHVLNVTTETWTQEQSTSSRLYVTCVIIGDQFIVWGGSNGSITYLGPPTIYSLTQKKWVESYTAPAYMKSLATVTGPLSVPTPPTPTSSSGSKNESKASSSPNLGAILGGVFGGLFVLTVASTIHLCLRRREDRAKYDAVSQKKDMKVKEKDGSRKEKDGSSMGMMNVQDRDLSSFRHPQKLQESQFPTRAVQNPQTVPNDMKFREIVNGPQQHYSENSKGIKVIPQPVKTIYTSGISTAATTASDRLGKRAIARRPLCTTATPTSTMHGPLSPPQWPTESRYTWRHRDSILR
ncbi:hypothetical protein BGZ92_000362 [Podila epicladia]|nr:hypothetical protein BGZ92_000362 [Podila epicladia]